LVDPKSLPPPPREGGRLEHIGRSLYCGAFKTYQNKVSKSDK
jgi:hypothetical protein